jgi:general secretion pathway protein G
MHRKGNGPGRPVPLIEGPEPGGFPFRKKRGFTIIELALVLAIISILSAIAIPKYLNYLYKSKVSVAISDIRLLQAKIREFEAERGLPDSLDSLPGAPFLDPWGNPYRYLNIATSSPGFIRKDKNLHPLNTDFDLYSMGPDGKTAAQVTSNFGKDDIIRANDGAFIGEASQY